MILINDYLSDNLYLDVASQFCPAWKNCISGTNYLDGFQEILGMVQGHSYPCAKKKKKRINRKKMDTANHLSLLI